jgi:hypothetical protein
VIDHELRQGQASISVEQIKLPLMSALGVLCAGQRPTDCQQISVTRASHFPTATKKGRQLPAALF